MKKFEGLKCPNIFSKILRFIFIFRLLLQSRFFNRTIFCDYYNSLYQPLMISTLRTSLSAVFLSADSLIHIGNIGLKCQKRQISNQNVSFYLRIQYSRSTYPPQITRPTCINDRDILNCKNCKNLKNLA